MVAPGDMGRVPHAQFPKQLPQAEEGAKHRSGFGVVTRALFPAGDLVVHGPRHGHQEGLDS